MILGIDLFLMILLFLITREMRNQWKNKETISPQDFEGYKKLVNLQKIFDKGFTELSDVPFNKPSFMLKQVPDLLGSKAINLFILWFHHL